MKVTHHDDFDTHAVIGGRDVQEFSMAQTAEFFTVLSSTLYSNKPLAVIREVLCNAWDSHIVSGCRDTPIVITVNEDKLTIRDFGKGIPHDKIHEIYCVYGNSTKENDGNQTGGFGLGSKAPFSYSDHFTVHNYHDGIKTVHAISRGSALSKGKPERRVMFTGKTTETGVEVIIPVKNLADAQTFRSIIKNIASYGEMNVVLNNHPVEIIPISKAENNIFLSTERPYNTDAILYVRYGNVVYPIPSDENYSGMYGRLYNLVKSVPRPGGKDVSHCLIMQAPANSISVTPSRESLSMTETTINTLRSLMEPAIIHLQTATPEFHNMISQWQHEVMMALINQGDMENLYKSSSLIKDYYHLIDKDKLEGFEFEYPYRIMTTMQLALYTARYSTMGTDLNTRLLGERVQLLIQQGARHQYKLKQYLAWMNTVYSNQNNPKMYYIYFDEFIQQVIMRPLYKRIAKTPLMNIKALNIVAPKYTGSTQYAWAYASKFSPSDSMDLDTRIKGLSLLQGVVVISYGKVVYEKDWMTLFDEHEKVPQRMPRLVYVASRTKGHKEAAVELFTKLGYWVIDYAKIVEEKEALHRLSMKVDKELSAKPVRVKRDPGLVPLTELLYTDYNRLQFSMRRHMRENAKRTTDYDYVIQPHNLSDKTAAKFFPWGDHEAVKLIQLFGSRIGIAVNSAQYEKQIKEGKLPGDVYIMQQLKDAVLTNPDIRRYVEYEKATSKAPSEVDYLIDICEHSLVLNKFFGFKKPTKPNMEMYDIYSTIAGKCYYILRHTPTAGWEKILYDLNQEVESWEASKDFDDVAAKLRTASVLNIMRMHDIRAMFKRSSLTTAERVFLETSIINAYKL